MYWYVSPLRQNMYYNLQTFAKKQLPIPETLNFNPHFSENNQLAFRGNYYLQF